MERRVLARVDGRTLNFAIQAIKSNADRDGRGAVTLSPSR